MSNPGEQLQMREIQTNRPPNADQVILSARKQRKHCAHRRHHGRGPGVQARPQMVIVTQIIRLLMKLLHSYIADKSLE